LDDDQNHDHLGHRQGLRRFVIREQTVDLFEAYIALVADALGLQLAWIDSWFYHVKFGGIHCGTNVLRVPGQVPPWWTISRLQL
jgi:hypothetical protein